MSLGSTVTAIGFWLGTLLPITYLPLIIVGLDSLSRIGLFVGLLVLNVIALIVGHDYSTPETI